MEEAFLNINKREAFGCTEAMKFFIKSWHLVYCSLNGLVGCLAGVDAHAEFLWCFANELIRAPTCWLTGFRANAFYIIFVEGFFLPGAFELHWSSVNWHLNWSHMFIHLKMDWWTKVADAFKAVGAFT